MYQRGLAMGQEAKGKGVHVLLGPSVGPLGRVPHRGRNWEGFGSDPYLQGWGGRQTVLVCIPGSRKWIIYIGVGNLTQFGDGIGYSRCGCASYGEALHRK